MERSSGANARIAGRLRTAGEADFCYGPALAFSEQRNGARARPHVNKARRYLLAQTSPIDTWQRSRKNGDSNTLHSWPSDASIFLHFRPTGGSNGWTGQFRQIESKGVAPHSRPRSTSGRRPNDGSSHRDQRDARSTGHQKCMASHGGANKAERRLTPGADRPCLPLSAAVPDR